MNSPLIDQLVYLFDLFGTAVFAFSGVLVAGRLRMDAIGVIVLAAVTAIGGGTIRDLLIGASPIFWIQDTTYLWVILGTAAFGMWLARVRAAGGRRLRSGTVRRHRCQKSLAVR